MQLLNYIYTRNFKRNYRSIIYLHTQLQLQLLKHIYKRNITYNYSNDELSLQWLSYNYIHRTPQIYRLKCNCIRKRTRKLERNHVSET